MSYLGLSWDQGMFGYTLGNTLLAPNPQYPNCRTCTWIGDWDCPGMYGLSSYHPGGGNIAMADGSVRFLKSSTAMQIGVGPGHQGRWRGRLVRPVLIRHAGKLSVGSLCLFLPVFDPSEIRHAFRGGRHPECSHSQECPVSSLSPRPMARNAFRGETIEASDQVGINVP